MHTASGAWQMYGDANGDVLVAGHSHAYALLAGRANVEAEFGLRTGVLYTAEGRDGAPGDAEYWAAAEEWSTGKTLALVWNGNQHNAEFLLAPDPPFRIHRPHIDSSREPGTWIPESLLRERWEPTISDARDLLAAVTARGDRALVIGTPPPKRPEFVSHRLLAEPYFVGLAAQHGFDLAKAAITGGPTRLAMWEIIQELLAEAAVDTGAEFIAVPAAARDPEGYLAAEYEGNDVTHANHLYGAIMWEAIAGHLTPRENR